MKKIIRLVFVVFCFTQFPIYSFAETGIHFNPETPLYIEYKSSQPTNDSDISVQIDDAKSPSKIRLSLQSKPETTSTYYGYLWLQLGKKMTNEVNFKRNKNVYLKGWLTEQDGIQALFLFDDEKELLDFKSKAAASTKPLTDKNNLPKLVNLKVSQPVTSKAIEINSEMNEVLIFGHLMNTYNQFTPEQKKINDQRAMLYSQSALKNYRLKKYALAESEFSQSLKLNPTSAINRYYLAICYYQTKKYERSLALLSLAEGADYNYAEYKYYTGLNLLKLKNYDKANENLDDARDENDSDYSGPAAFFSGHIYFQKEDYPQARQNFEYTIDHSKNPKMDHEAEMMLEKIDMIEGYKNQMKERFKYSLFFGVGYDSNVLNVSTENLSTNVAAYRFIYGANLGYKFLYDYQQDLSTEFAASDYYSLDDKLKSDATVQSTDPQQFSVGLPYHRRFQYGPRIYTWGFLPSYQILNMSIEDNQRKKIQDSTVIASDLNFAVSENYYSKIYIEYSSDHSDLTVTSEADNLSAKKMSLLTTQTFITEPMNKKMWLVDLGYILNAADGDNNDYAKIQAGLTYSQMGFWKATNSAKLDLSNAKYDHTSSNRSDNVATLTLGLAKDLNKKINLGFSGLYTISQSNVDAYKYNKFGVQSILTYSGAF